MTLISYPWLIRMDSNHHSPDPESGACAIMLLINEDERFDLPSAIAITLLDRNPGVEPKFFRLRAECFAN